MPAHTLSPVLRTLGHLAAGGATIADTPSLAAAELNATTIRLSLTPPSDVDYDHCEIHRRTVSAVWEKLCDLSSGTYDDTVAEAVTYYYVAVAVNGIGGSPRLSHVVSFATGASVTIDALDLAGDAYVFFGDFAEEVIYRPVAGGTRAIAALVDREPQDQPVPGNAMWPFIVTVLNSAAFGICVDELNTGGDRIEVAGRVGESRVTRRIARVAGHDAGVLTLEVR